MTPPVAIGRCPEAEVPHLFGLAKSVFADARGWSDARVLEALARDLLFLAEEDGQPAGYVALRREPDGAIVVEQDNASARDFYRRSGFIPVDTELVERSLPTS